MYIKYILYPEVPISWKQSHRVIIAQTLAQLVRDKKDKTCGDQGVSGN